MDKEQAIQNKKRSIRESRQKRNRVETEEQKVKRLREKRERQQQMLVNETAEEKEIRLAKRREAYKKRSEQSKEKSILGRGLGKNAEKGDSIDCKG